jgi:hypothetical protein
MKRTFFNPPSGQEDKAKFIARAKASMKMRAKDFVTFMRREDLDEPNPREKEELGSFYDYGLSFDYVAPDTFRDEHEGYFRYQLSYGGPSSEIRFYANYKARQPYRIEFIFLDWGEGIGYDVTEKDWAQWLWEQFNETCSTDYEFEKAMEL